MTLLGVVACNGPRALRMLPRKSHTHVTDTRRCSALSLQEHVLGQQPAGWPHPQHHRELGEPSVRSKGARRFRSVPVSQADYASIWALPCVRHCTAYAASQSGTKHCTPHTFVARHFPCRYMGLDSNQLAGPLPSAIGNLASLECVMGHDESAWCHSLHCTAYAASQSCTQYTTHGTHSRRCSSLLFAGS